MTVHGLKTFDVLSYNVAFNNKNAAVNFVQLATYIQKEGFDLVFLQEVADNTRYIDKGNGMSPWRILKTNLKKDYFFSNSSDSNKKKT